MSKIKNRPKFTKISGFTLIEIILSLSIVATLTSLVFVAYPRVSAKNAATYENQVLSTSKGSIKGFFVSGNYADLSTLMGARLNFFPEKMRFDDDIKHQWDGDVILSPSTQRGDDTSDGHTPYFKITYTLVPKDICMRMVIPATENFQAVYIGDNNDYEVINRLDNDLDNDVVDEASVINKCASDNFVSITFVSN